MSEKVSISKKMQGKMTGFWTLNTSPLDNMFCEAMSRNPKSVCYNCYSRKTLNTYAKQARKPWKRNGKILSSKLMDDADIPVINKELPIDANTLYSFQYAERRSHRDLITADTK